jgi:hypothetical protein
MFTHSHWSTKLQHKRLCETATNIGQIIHRRRARTPIDRDLGKGICEGFKFMLEGKSLYMSVVADIRCARIPIPSLLKHLVCKWSCDGSCMAGEDCACRNTSRNTSSPKSRLSPPKHRPGRARSRRDFYFRNWIRSSAPSNTPCTIAMVPSCPPRTRKW